MNKKLALNILRDLKNYIYDDGMPLTLNAELDIAFSIIYKYIDKKDTYLKGVKK